MSLKDELNKIEQKAFKTYHKDGIIDIGLGFVIILFGITILFDLFWLGGLGVVFFLPIYTSAKKSITNPRIGYVKFGRASRSQNTVTFLILACTIVGVILFLSL